MAVTMFKFAKLSQLIVTFGVLNAFLKLFGDPVGSVAFDAVSSLVRIAMGGVIIGWLAWFIGSVTRFSKVWNWMWAILSLILIAFGFAAVGWSIFSGTIVDPAVGRSLAELFRDIIEVVFAWTVANGIASALNKRWRS